MTKITQAKLEAALAVLKDYTSVSPLLRAAGNAEVIERMRRSPNPDVVIERVAPGLYAIMCGPEMRTAEQAPRHLFAYMLQCVHPSLPHRQQMMEIKG